MARSQFKVTFTNAQPGAPVEILTPSTEHVYPSATSVAPVGGRQLYLDATNSITVWSDAQAVIAQTVDGAGLYIEGTATLASATITVSDGTAPTNPSGSAASVTGAFQTYAGAGVNLPGLGATLALIAWSEDPANVYTVGTPGVVATGDGKVTFTADGTYSIAFTLTGINNAATNSGALIEVSDNFVTGDGLVFFNSPRMSIWNSKMPPTTLDIAQSVITLPPLPLKAGDWVQLQGRAEDPLNIEVRLDVVRTA